MAVKPLVSIIVPVFNKEKWILQTLQSIASQTYENWECIVVDDGSSDRSLSLIHEFTNSTKGNWKVISQINAGQSPARNTGLRTAKGDFVAFLDGDDLWLPNKLLDQVNFLIARPEVDALVSGYTIFELGQKSRFRVVIHRSAERMIHGWLTMRGFGGLIESTGIIKRATLLELGGFDEALSTSAGLDLSVRLFTECNLETLPISQVMYRLSSDQWHKNTVELKKDMDTIAKRYSTKLAGLSQIHKWHKSYYYWSGVSESGKTNILSALLTSIPRIRIRDWLMLSSLISRNFLAQFRGRRVVIDLLIPLE